MSALFGNMGLVNVGRVNYNKVANLFMKQVDMRFHFHTE